MGTLHLPTICKRMIPVENTTKRPIIHFLYGWVEYIWWLSQYRPFVDWSTARALNTSGSTVLSSNGRPESYTGKNCCPDSWEPLEKFVAPTSLFSISRTCLWACMGTEIYERIFWLVYSDFCWLVLHDLCYLQSAFFGQLWATRNSKRDVDRNPVIGHTVQVAASLSK